MMLPALSVKQPWADLIATRDKDETRTWVTYYRGPLVICSSALPKGYGVTRRAVCVAFLRHCRPMRPEDEARTYCPIYEKANVWEFAEQRIRLKAIENVRGQLGIFGLPLPESEFFTPEDRALAYKWLDWAKEKGMLEKIKEWQPRNTRNTRKEKS